MTTFVLVVIGYCLVGFLLFRPIIAEYAQEEGYKHNPIALLLAVVWVIFIWPIILVKGFIMSRKEKSSKKTECDCWSTMFDEEGNTVHFESCAVIQEYKE